MQHRPPPPLFSPPDQAEHNDTEPSRERSVSRKDQRARRRGVVLDCIRRAGREGVSNQEISDRCNIRESSVCSATNELAKLGLIEKLPQRRYSRYSDGRTSEKRHQVWITKRV